MTHWRGAALLAVMMVSMWPAAAQPAPAVRRVAVTFDDLPFVFWSDVSDQARYTRALLAAIGAHDVPAIGFVNERGLYPGGRLDPRRIELLRAWLDAGLELGNHTFSHPSLHDIPVDSFLLDLARGEGVLRPLLAERGLTPRYFRHPFLHTGRSIAVRARVDSFLAERGYRVAPVTLDNADYLFARAYDLALVAADTATLAAIEAEYLAYLDAVFAYYEQQSQALLGYEPPQVLLLHASALNASTFDRLAAQIERRGYRFVPLDEALVDAAYQLPDTYTGAGGITWLHRWALTAGRRGAFFAGEPVVPAWIESRAATPRAELSSPE